MVDDIINSDSSPPVSRRKNLIPGVDDAHLALGGVGLTLVALGIVSWPNIQDWISKTFKMPPPNGAAVPVPANGQAGAPAAQPVVVPPPPVVVNNQMPEQKNEELPYPYLRRQNITPVGQAVSVSAMETVPDRVPEQQQQQQKKVPQQQGYYSPFGASISGEVG